MASIFSSIVSGEIPSYKVAENETHLAFLDVFPLSPGHTLVIPKKETDYLFDLPEQDFAALMLFARKVAKAVHKAFPACVKVGMSVVGLEVPHAHIHLIPIKQVGDMNFSKAKTKAEDSELLAIASRIAGFME